MAAKIHSAPNPPARKRFSAEARRDQLLRTAMGLFSDSGFENTTTKAIAEAAGVSEGIIFQHFATKEELYKGILDYKAKEAGIGEWEARLRRCIEREDDEGLVLALVRQILESDRRDPQFQRLMFQAALNGHALPKIMAQRILPLRRVLCDYITRRQKKGAFRKCDPDLAVHAIVSLPSYYGLAKTLFGVDDLRIPAQGMALSFTRLILEGLQASSGSARRNGREHAKLSKKG